MDEDTEDDYSRYQSTERPLRSKYEAPRRSLAEQQATKKGKTFMMYPNDDSTIKSFKLFFSSKKHRKLDSIFGEIERLQQTVNFDNRTFKFERVSRIFVWPSMQEVTQLSELDDEDADTLVYSDRRNIAKRSVIERQICGGQSQLSRNSYNSRGSQKASPTLRSNGSMQSINFPASINVKCNTNPENTCSLFINPKQDFQVVLSTITDMLAMDDNPCLCLRPVKQLKTQVDSMSSFKRLNPNVAGDFIACGSEGPPVESHSPTRNGRARNGMANGNTRQSKNFKDSKGRAYQRHDSNKRNQYDDEDGSPTNRTSRRDTHREGPYGSHRNDKASPRRHDDQNGHRQDSDRHGDDDRHGKGTGRDRDIGDDTNSEPPSRSNSPDDDEMQKRIEAMEDTSKNDLDKDIKY